MKKLNSISRLITILYLIAFICVNIIFSIYSMYDSNNDIIDVLSLFFSIFLIIVLLLIFWEHKTYNFNYFKNILCICFILFAIYVLGGDIKSPKDLSGILTIDLPAVLALISTVTTFLENKYKEASLNKHKKLYLLLSYINTALFFIAVIFISKSFLYYNLFRFF